MTNLQQARPFFVEGVGIFSWKSSLFLYCLHCNLYQKKGVTEDQTFLNTIRGHDKETTSYQTEIIPTGLNMEGAICGDITLRGNPVRYSGPKITIKFSA
jgi:hypothetical protein